MALLGTYFKLNSILISFFLTFHNRTLLYISISILKILFFVSSAVNRKVNIISKHKNWYFCYERAFSTLKGAVLLFLSLLLIEVLSKYWHLQSIKEQFIKMIRNQYLFTPFLFQYFHSSFQLKAFYVDLLVPLETNIDKDTKVVAVSISDENFLLCFLMSPFLLFFICLLLNVVPIFYYFAIKL